jgi:hypothetical protein
MHFERAHDSVQVIALNARRRGRIDLHQLIVQKRNSTFSGDFFKFGANLR